MAKKRKSKPSTLDDLCKEAGIDPGLFRKGKKLSVPFDVGCRLRGIPEPVAEFKFAAHLGRKFSADWCWPEKLLILEVEGGVWIKGRHTRPSGFLKDIQKYNLAATLGYRLLRCTPKEINDGSIYETVERALGGALAWR